MRYREAQAEYERSIGIPDREPYIDRRDPVDLDMRSHGGKRWRMEPRRGYTSCRLVDVETGAVDYCGTAKQCMRYLSRHLAHVLGPRNLQ